MEPLTGADSTEDIPGRKKSKLKILKSRLFKRSKKEDEGSYKLSQSTSDITAGKRIESEEDLPYTEVMLGSRALSHDSIFVADEALTQPEPSRVLSQENVHSKIKALQEKLQQQKLHLGPPPMGLSIKRPIHLARPTESASQEALNKEILQLSDGPLSPAHAQSPTRRVSPMLFRSSPTAVLPISPTTTTAAADLAVDFSSPARVVSCLDTSAARHRMSVKPRNQRASSKGPKRTTHARPVSDLPNNMNHPALEEENSCPSEEESSMSSHSIQIPQSEAAGVNISSAPQCVHLDSVEVEAIQREAQASPQQETSGMTPKLPRAKYHPPMDLEYCQQPSCGETEGNKTDHLADIGIQAESHARQGNDFNSTGLKGKNLEGETSSKGVSISALPSRFGSVESFRSSSLKQHRAPQVSEGTRRQGHGSGSFRFISAKGQDAERPRSGSFGVQGEHAVTRLKDGSVSKPFTSNVHQLQGHDSEKKHQEEEQSEDLQQQRGAGISKHADVKDKAAFILRRTTLKKVESAQPPKQAAIMTGVVVGVDGYQEGVEESVDAKEDLDEPPTAAFGVKLRSTSLSLRYRTEGPAPSVKRHSVEIASSAPLLVPGSPTLSSSIFSGEKGDRRNIDDEADKNLSGRRLGGTRPWSFRHAGGAVTQPSFSSLPDKPNPMQQDEASVPTPETPDISLNTRDRETTSDTPQDQTASQPAPQSAPADVSWMSMAMEKTRSLQQLFSIKMPRDFTGAQSAAWQHTPGSPTNQGQNVSQFQANKGIQSQVQLASQTQAVAQHDIPQIPATSQPLTEAMKPPVIKAVSSAQTAKPFQVSTTVPPISKQAHNMPFQPNTAQPIMQSSMPTASSVFAAPSASRPSTQMENMAQSAPGSAPSSPAQASVSSGRQPTVQQAFRAGGGLQQGNQFKPTASALTTSNTAPSPAQASALASQVGAAEEGASQSGKGSAWSTSVGERAGVLEGGSSRRFKVDHSKSRTNTQSPVDTLYSIHLNKDTTSEMRPGGQLAGRPSDNEEKRSRQRTSSSPSSSATPSSPVQSAPDRTQPSWMDLAKRKSMAWSDKTMD